MWKVTVHCSDNGPVAHDYRTRRAPTLKRALEQAIILAAGDVATWDYLNRIGPDGTPDKIARRQNIDAMLSLICTLTGELAKTPRRRWYNSKDCMRFSFEGHRLAHATFERIVSPNHGEA